MSDAMVKAWVQQVARCDEPELPVHVRQGVLSCGEAAGPLLLDLCEDLAVWDSFAAYHVVQLIGELRYEPGIHFLVDLLWDEPDLTGVHEALLGFGESAIPFLLLNVETFPDELLPTIVELSRGKRREDVREAFEVLLDSGAPSAAEWAGQLGDPALLPALHRSLKALDDSDAANRDQIVDLVDAIEELGGELGGLEQKAANVRQANALRLAMMGAAAHRKGKRRKRRR